MGRTITAITPAKGALALYVKECGRGFFTKDVPVQCWALTHDTHGDAVFTEVWGMVAEPGSGSSVDTNSMDTSTKGWNFHNGRKGSTKRSRDVPPHDQNL
jgi:hypothetical protein